MVDYVQAFIELGFPVGVALFLLTHQSRQLDRVRMTLLEVKIGMNLILRKLDADAEYEKAVGELRKETSKDDGV